MTIGIYALYWEEQDLIYIGKSQNIEKRFKQHCNLMRSNSHTNYKVNNAYSLYGEPKYIIIEICHIQELDVKEKLWQNEFNSLNSLDIIEAGTLGGYGIHTASSKYSIWRILRVFSLLYKTSISYKEIAIKVGVPYSLVKDIGGSCTHCWLQDKYPDNYALMIKARALREHNRIKKISKESGVIVQDTYGNTYLIGSIIEFCRTCPILLSLNVDPVTLSKGFHGIISGRRRTYKGFKVLQTH